jgi:hypothetical protein
MTRLSTQGSSGAASTATIHTKAPGALRRRVLGRVRGEANRPGRHLRRASAAIVGLLLLFTLVLFLAHVDDTQHTRSASAKLGARVPRVSLHRVGDRGELTMSGMSDPPIGEIYELWLDRPGQAPQPTDELFTVTSAGSATVDIPGSLRGLRTVMVSAEPLGGSTSPTSPPIVRVKLPD